MAHDQNGIKGPLGPTAATTQSLRRILKEILWTCYSWRLSNPPLKEPPKTILFICKGNICRSPFAHYYAARCTKHLDHISIDSAGVHAKAHNPPPPDAIAAARHCGISMESHQARGVTADDINSNDLVVVMEPWHRRILIKRFPEVQPKIFLLAFFLAGTEFHRSAYERCNILDPYGKGLPVFIDAFQRIQSGVDHLLAEVMRLPFSQDS